MLSDLSKIKDLIRNNFKIVQNTGYLTIIECVRLILPFVALPYIIRIVGLERYGMVAFAQAVIAYFGIFINFGLDVSSVKDVALLKDKKKELNNLVTSVLAIKSVLFLLSFGVLLLCIFIIPVMYNYKTLLLFAFLSCLSELLFPIWYYQGIEKMKLITLVSSSSILLYTILVFVFIHNREDYVYVPLLQSLSNIVAGSVAFISLIKCEGVKLCIPRLQFIIQVLKNAVPFFLSRVSVVYNSNLAKTISGLFLSMESVAAFDIAQKISNFALVPVRMLNQATYPYISRIRSKLFITKYLYLSAMIGLTLSIVLFLTSPILIRFFTNESVVESTEILRILCLFTFSDTITMCLGTCTLVAFGFSKPFNDSVIYSTIFLSLLYYLIYYFELFNTSSFAFAIFLSSFFVLVYRMCFCIKYDIFQFRYMSIMDSKDRNH